MFEALIEQIQKAVEPITVNLNGENYFSRNVYLPPEAPTVKTRNVLSLQGLIEYCKLDPDAAIENGAFLLVSSPTNVRLVSPFFGRHEQHHVFVEADCHSLLPIRKDYISYLEVEDFILRIQNFFVQSEVTEDLLQILSRIEIKDESAIEDDGLSQSVTTRSGISTLTQKELPRWIPLRPYRTFPEIEQPSSDYVFRMKQSGKEAYAKLSESESPQWKVEAMNSIRQYLTEKLGEDFPVVG